MLQRPAREVDGLGPEAIVTHRHEARPTGGELSDPDRRPIFATIAQRCIDTRVLFLQITNQQTISVQAPSD